MVSERREYASSDEAMGEGFGLMNGIKNVSINGLGGLDTPSSPVSSSPEGMDAAAEPGMHCALKHLYSGKEDKRGRFQWQDTIPEDVGKPVENSETAKYALLVRNVKVYNDPRKVLKIHSLVVQSPYLKKLLQNVLKDYPGIALNLKRLELTGKFEPIIHRWAKLQEAIAELGDETEEGKETKKHADLFQDLLRKEFEDVIDTSQDMISQGVITYDLLWTAFQPASLVYAKQDGQETALKLTSTKYGIDRNGNPVFWVQGKYVDWDGTRWGTNKVNIMCPAYTGTKRIASLPAYPLDYHPEKDQLTQRLLERGTKLESLAGSHYKAYNGVGWRRNPFGTYKCYDENGRVKRSHISGGRDKHNVQGRIVIDTYSWNRFQPNYAVYVTPLNQKDPTERQYNEDGDEDDDDDGGYGDDADIDDDDEGGMPLDGHFLDEDDASTRLPLTAEQKIICTSLIRGYSLSNKLWLNMYVNAVNEIEFSSNAFDKLVLPEKQKELILGFTESQKAYQDCFDDVIEGKGKGIILLLMGPPGVGKTLTAESVAEEMRVPLYMMSAGDLGVDPRHVENTLKDIMEMCTKWNAILLLDEADVFLEQRSLHELERNKLVSIFLRVVEYFKGIMVLTTNRVETFDPAFQSRIHISLDYPSLSVESRRMIWKNFLEASTQKNTITERQLDQLAYMDINGRQIKNILKTAQLLARRKSKVLEHEHILTVLDCTQHLHHTNQQTERARAGIYC